MSDESQPELPLPAEETAQESVSTVAEEPAVPTTPPVLHTGDHVREVIDAWFRTFPGSPVAQTVEQWNYLHTMIADLRARF